MRSWAGTCRNYPNAWRTAAETAGRNWPWALTEVVAALQQAQADTVLVGQYQDDETLLALGADPWLCGEDSEDHAELVIGSWPAPEVLLRATALTDATIRYVPEGVLPEGVGIAALLRWPKTAVAGS